MTVVRNNIAVVFAGGSCSYNIEVVFAGYNNNNKQVYLQLDRVGFTYTVHTSISNQGNEMRRHVIRNVIYTNSFAM